MKLLLVDDDILLQEDLSRAFCSEGYTLDHATTTASADTLVQSSDYSLIILSLDLPASSGATLLSQWRRCGMRSPVLILTAYGALEERLNALDSGADDFLIKPFAVAELLARARTLVRRYLSHRPNLLVQDDLTLNLHTQQVRLQDQPLEITPKEFILLTHLMTHSGQIVQREALQQAIFSWQDDSSSNTLEVHIHHLRRKLGKDRIKTLRGVGYRLESRS